MTITTIKCNICEHEFEVVGRYDEIMTEITTCPNCKIGVSTFCYDYIKVEVEEDE